jgi:hypothetical protein
MCEDKRSLIRGKKERKIAAKLYSCWVVQKMRIVSWNDVINDPAADLFCFSIIHRELSSMNFNSCTEYSTKCGSPLPT